MAFTAKQKTASAPTPDAPVAKEAGAVTSPAIEPQDAQRNVMEVTVNTSDQQVSEALMAAGSLPPLPTVLEMVDSGAPDLMAMPPECAGGNKHPVYRFVWVPLPDTDPRKAQFQRFCYMGYAVCNRDTPAASFWTSFKTRNPHWQFHADGSIRCQNNILMVTYQESFKRREAKRLSISKERSQNNQGIENYGTDERNLPGAMKSNQMAAQVHDDGAVDASPALQEVFASASQ